MLKHPLSALRLCPGRACHPHDLLFEFRISNKRCESAIASKLAPGSWIANTRKNQLLQAPFLIQIQRNPSNTLENLFFYVARAKEPRVRLKKLHGQFNGHWIGRLKLEHGLRQSAGEREFVVCEVKSPACLLPSLHCRSALIPNPERCLYGILQFLEPSGIQFDWLRRVHNLDPIIRLKVAIENESTHLAGGSFVPPPSSYRRAAGPRSPLRRRLSATLPSQH